MHEACREVHRLLELGYDDFHIAINVSPQQFVHGDLLGDLRDALASYGLLGRYLEVEVTEGLLLQESEPLQEKLERLKALGVTLALDDFGTGYSSLAYLRKFSFDALKIDRSFVMTLPDSDEDMDIVKALLAMGRALGLSVVAEGLETAEQMRFLRAEGCSVFQGYYFGKPMPGDAFHDWLDGYTDTARPAGTVSYL
jgi:EAL domain-containing protein (putative c-di-GMP-specific phosphodiesterase class I)